MGTFPKIMGCFFMTLFSAYQVNHTRREQNEPLKLSLNYFCGNEYFKHFSTVKLIWNFPIRPERKIFLRQKNFGPYFFSLNSVLASVGVPLCYRMSLQGIRRLRKVTVYVFASTCSIIENNYNIVTQNLWLTILGGLSQLITDSWF